MDSDMYQIPYIEHKKQMYKAYKREQILKTCLIATNALWATVSLIGCVRKKLCIRTKND